jgi:hypothetical protein
MGKNARERPNESYHHSLGVFPYLYQSGTLCLSSSRFRSSLISLHVVFWYESLRSIQFVAIKLFGITMTYVRVFYSIFGYPAAAAWDIRRHDHPDPYPAFRYWVTLI